MKHSKNNILEISGFSITVVYKSVKNWYVRLYPPDGQIHMTVPRFMPHDAIVKIIASQENWIKRQQEKLCAQPQRLPPKMIEGECHYFQGEPYLLRIIKHYGRNKVLLRDHAHIELHVDENSDTQLRLEILHRWYRTQLKKIVPPLLIKWQAIIGVNICDWRIKSMKTLWGSCNTQEKRIWLNLELVTKPVACLEYIIVHELVHLLERKHNKRFYAYMDKFLPNWRELKGVLEKGALHTTCASPLSDSGCE